MKKIIAVILALAFLSGMAYLISWMNQSKTYEFELEEVDDNIYCYYETIVSRVPAQNYTIMTLCVNGGVRIIKGDLQIIYVSDITPRCVWKAYNYVNGNEVTVYIPKGSLEYLGTSSNNRR